MPKGRLTCFAGFLWISVLGTLLHFTYEWSGCNSFIGLFSAVNESVWEHMKLLFFPAASFSIILYPFFRRKIPSFLTAWGFAVFIAMLLQTSVFYTYSGIIGKNIPAADILLFYVCSLVCSILAIRFTKKNINTGSLWGLAIFCGLSVCFFRFTKNPPDLGIFQIPLL